MYLRAVWEAVDPGAALLTPGLRAFFAVDPGAARRNLWGVVTKDRRSVKMVRLEDVDTRGCAVDSLPQRAKCPSAGGDVTMRVSPTSSGRVCRLPPLWAPEETAVLCSGPPLASAAEAPKVRPAGIAKGRRAAPFR